eukprot:11715344-Heterocapsa_arctica.AAC.1
MAQLDCARAAADECASSGPCAVAVAAAWRADDANCWAHRAWSSRRWGSWTELYRFQGWWYSDQCWWAKGWSWDVSQ